MTRPIIAFWSPGGAAARAASVSLGQSALMGNVVGAPLHSCASLFHLIGRRSVVLGFCGGASSVRPPDFAALLVSPLRESAGVPPPDVLMALWGSDATEMLASGILGPSLSSGACCWGALAGPRAWGCSRLCCRPERTDAAA
eukprot:10339779-Heterocapsa_arctica.AAC.1